MVARREATKESRIAATVTTTKTCRKLKLFFYVTYVRTQGKKATYTAIDTQKNHIRKLVATIRKPPTEPFIP